MEAIVGKLGLDRLIDPKTLKVGKRDLARAAKFSTTFVNRLEKFLNQERPSKYSVSSSQIQTDDFDAIIEDLKQDFSFQQLVDKFDVISVEDSEEFIMDYMNIISTLQRARPQTEVATVLGTEPSEPSNSEKNEFIWLCRLASDIEWIFELMESNTLTQSEAALFQQLYPETYQSMGLQLATLLVEKSTDKVNKLAKTWKLPVIAAFMQTASVSQENLVMLQQSFQAEQPQSTETSSANNVAVQQHLSASQKLEENT